VEVVDAVVDEAVEEFVGEAAEEVVGEVVEVDVILVDDEIVLKVEDVGASELPAEDVDNLNALDVLSFKFELIGVGVELGRGCGKRIDNMMLIVSPGIPERSSNAKK